MAENERNNGSQKSPEDPGTLCLRSDPAELVTLSPIRELAIHLVWSTVVRAWGSLPTSFTVRMRCRDDLSSFTASSCRMLRKLRPFTSRIWSPTCQDPAPSHGLTSSQLSSRQTEMRSVRFREAVDAGGSHKMEMTACFQFQPLAQLLSLRVSLL